MHMELAASLPRAAGTHTDGETVGKREAHSSGVSWPAVIAGAFVTAALSLALLTLGTGLGFSVASPGVTAENTAARVGRTAIIWLVFMQSIASVVGGYLAGRLRTRWVAVHTHEVFFRDTAHGFLVWAVSLVITAAFLTSAAGSIVGRTAGTAARGPNAYWGDTLLRANVPSSENTDATRRVEIADIFAKSLSDGRLSTDDRSYLAHVVATRAGISDTEAATRVDAVYAEAEQAVARTKHAIAHSMYWTFVALLIGAFCASVGATMGGKERDRVVVL
jgi:hypothetical protein